MSRIRLSLFVFMVIITIIIFTVAYLWASMPRGVAVDVHALPYVTVYSPFYWILLLLVIGAEYWLCRDWLRQATSSK